MPKQIIIGKEGNQPFALRDPKVSRRHAVLMIDDNGQLQLQDKQSTNGTFIYNGQQFVRIQPLKYYRVSPDTMVQLGPDTRFHVRRLLGGKEGVPADKVDITGLRYLAAEYEETKIALQAKNAGVNSLRSLTLVCSMAASIIGPILGEALDNVKLGTICGLGVAGILILVLLMIVNSRSKKILIEQNNNEKKYSLGYCCPKCHVSFKGKMYENILAEGACPKCKVKYYETPQYAC